MEENKKLKKLIKEYEKVCDKLDQLNNRAFELEQEIHYQESILKDKNDKK